MPPNQERRRFDRGQTRLDARCKFGLNQTAQVLVSDISCVGCHITIKRCQLEKNAYVLLKIPGLEGLPARVIWITGDRFGLEFERPIHEAVLNHLLMGETPRDVCEQTKFTDRFGRALQQSTTPDW